MHNLLIMLLFCGLMLSGGIFLDAANAQSGEIRGKVELAPARIAQSTAGPQSRYRRQAAETSSSQTEERPVLIWIEGSAPISRVASAVVPLLDQKELQFEPRLVAVIAGEKVRVVNSDPVFHNVFSLSSVKRFDIGRRPRGEQVEVVFDQPGTVQVFCDIHSHMSATIVVLPKTTLKWSIFGENTDFQLDALPAGTYRMHVVSPGYRELVRQITVTTGSTLDLGTLRLEAS